MPKKKFQVEDLKEDLKNALIKSNKFVEELGQRQNSLLKSIDAGECVACHGRIIGTYCWHDPRPDFIGHKQMTVAFEGYHCDQCGLVYKHPPKK